MPDFRNRSTGPNEGESLDAIAHSDQLLDALAGQYRVRPSDAGEAELLSLLEGWRDGVRRPPSTNVISEQDAMMAVQRGLSARPTAPKGTRRHLAVVGSVAAAVLCIGGFGAVVAGAGPGDSLYGMRTALFGEPQSVRDDRVALAAQTEMAEVQRLIDQGDWAQAQEKLETVTTAVADVEDTTRKQELVNEWHQLNVKVETRDPAATLPPPAPGDPSLTLPIPAVEVTPPSETTSETTPPSETTSETTPPSETTSPGETTSPSETTTPVETTSPTTSVGSAEPTSTTAPSPTPSSAPSSTTNPTTTPPTTTTSSSVRTTTTTAPTTTTTTTTTTEAVAEAPEPSTVAPSSTLVEAETEAVPTAAEETPVQQAPVIVTPTTTTVPGGGPLIQLPIPGFN